MNTIKTTRSTWVTKYVRGVIKIVSISCVEEIVHKSTQKTQKKDFQRELMNSYLEYTTVGRKLLIINKNCTAIKKPLLQGRYNTW